MQKNNNNSQELLENTGTQFIHSDKSEVKFYQLPQFLFRSSELSKISDGAKLLYTLLYDRVSLSIKNGLEDEKGIYVFYTIPEACYELGKSRITITKFFKELDTADLIERVKAKNNVTKIYVKCLHNTKKQSNKPIFNKIKQDIHNDSTPDNAPSTESVLPLVQNLYYPSTEPVLPLVQNLYYPSTDSVLNQDVPNQTEKNQDLKIETDDIKTDPSIRTPPPAQPNFDGWIDGLSQNKDDACFDLDSIPSLLVESFCSDVDNDLYLFIFRSRFDPDKVHRIFWELLGMEEIEHHHASADSYSKHSLDFEISKLLHSSLCEFLLYDKTKTQKQFVTSNNFLLTLLKHIHFDDMTKTLRINNIADSIRLNYKESAQEQIIKHPSAYMKSIIWNVMTIEGNIRSESELAHYLNRFNRER